MSDRSKSPEKDSESTTEDNNNKSYRSRSSSPSASKKQSRSASPNTSRSPSIEKGEIQEEEEDDDDDDDEEGEVSDAEQPPLPNELPPPLPDGPPPSTDGWEAIWEPSVGAFYFFNSVTGASTWTNPRVPDVPNPIPDHAPGTTPPPPTLTTTAVAATNTTKKSIEEKERPHGGYDPAIHGDYDPTAPYAQAGRSPSPDGNQLGAYQQSAAFNRFTGKYQPETINTENHNDENKTKRQMEFYFDVDAAANSHDGRSLKAERQNKRLTKQEVKAFREKRKERKEEKRKAWLRD